MPEDNNSPAQAEPPPGEAKAEPSLLDYINNLSNNISSTAILVVSQVQSKIHDEITKMQSDLAGAAKKVLQAALSDYKTNLLNERALNEKRKHLFEAGTSIFSGDINNFKSLNDEIGYEMADLVIYSAGAKLGEITAQFKDTEAFRRGGDEFVVISPPLGSILQNSLRALINHDTGIPYPKKPGETVKITIAFGHAKLKPNEAFLDALKRADAACKAAKWKPPSSNENVVDWTDDIQSGASKRVRCESCSTHYNITIPPDHPEPSQGNCWTCGAPITLPIKQEE